MMAALRCTAPMKAPEPPPTMPIFSFFMLLPSERVPGSASSAVVLSSGDRRDVGLQYIVGQVHGAASFGGAIERHEHLDHGNAGAEGLQRLFTLAERFDHVSVFEGIAVCRSLVLKHRHQALLGALLLDEVLAFGSGHVPRE